MLYQETLICILLTLNLCSGFIDLSNVDYCSLCGGSHTACLYPSEKQPGACELKPLPMSDKKEILRIHNQLRAKVANGQESRGKGGAPQPKASNMLRMRWDFELEAIARRWALQCIDNHDKCRDSTRFSVGQNIAWNSIWNGVEDQVNMWYDEVKDFDPAEAKNFVFRMETGHYAQLVWAKTYLVGCAKTDRGGAKGLRFTFICNYAPAGNMQGTTVYLEGEPASACPKGAKPDTTYNGLCSTDDEDFEDIKLAKSIRLKAPHTAAPMPLTRLLIFAMVFRKCWDLLCAFIAI